MGYRSNKYLVGSFYRQPSCKVDFWAKVEASLEQAKLSGIKRIIIMGDFNCNQLIPNNKLSRLLDQFHLHQLIKEPTHCNNCLDVIITSCPDLVTGSGVTDPIFSWHCGVFANFKLAIQKQNHFKRTIWQYNLVNWNQLNEHLKSLDWSEVYKEKTANEQCEKWTSLYTKALKYFIPNKQVTINPNDAPWMNHQIKTTMKKREKAYKKAKRTNQEADHDKYKNLRNETIAMIREAKENYNKTLANKLTGDSKTDNKLWWKIVKYFYTKNSANAISNPPIENENTIAHSNQEKANIFNDFFASQSKLDTGDADPGRADHGINTLSKIAITRLTVQEILQSLDPSKASGPDNISPRVLKQTATSIAPSLARIFNFSLASKKCPDAWKLANVTPLHKKDNRQQVKNYRPISLLSCVGKVFERCVFKEVFNFLHTNKLFTKFQSAYMPNSATTDQLIELYHIILEALEKKKAVRFVFCDISKAFDKVWHKGVLHKLKGLGVIGGIHDWFSDYLNNRKQRVVFNGCHSDWQTITAGVPQGSILGPLLFLIYINDLPDEIKTNIRIYADDTTLFVSSKSKHEAARKLTKDLENVSRWAARWFVGFNPTKTEGMSFSHVNVEHIPPIYMDGKLINEVTSHKHLGLTFQSSVKWSEHINEIVKKAMKRVDILRSLMYQLDRATLEKMYFTFVRPVLEYGDVVWDNCTEMESKTIENVQLSAARVVTGATRGTSHATIYRECGWEPLFKRREKHKLTTFYKIENNIIPDFLKKLVPPVTKQRTIYGLRSKENITSYKASTTTMQRSFIPSTITSWNRLDIETRNSTSISAFKSELNKKSQRTPRYYYTGSRKGQVHHARMRMSCSALNYHLKLNFIKERATCRCSAPCENVYHFLFQCPLYTQQRILMLNKLSPRIIRNVKTFLNGSEKFSEEQNTHLFNTVIDYIETTNRF